MSPAPTWCWDWTDDREAAIARAEQALAQLDLIAPDLPMTRLAHASEYADAEHALRLSVLANPRVAFYGVVLAAAVAEQGRRDEAEKLLAETLARHPNFSRASIANFWVAPDARSIAGRDRIIAVPAGLGLPP